VYNTDHNPNIIGFTNDHKPNKDDLVSDKSFISANGRLNGVLAVGRTIGDNTPELWGCINRTPSQITVGYNKSFRVILATDGLYDIVPMETIMNSSTERMKQYEYYDNMTMISVTKK
jgi:serine/threonine protein phosphatase PrpC